MKKLRIAAGEIDLKRQEVVVDFAVADLTDVNVTVSDSTRTFSVPGTREVMRLLGMPDEHGSANFTEQDATLEIDGVPVLKGLLRLVRLSDDRGNIILDLELIGGNGKLANVLDRSKVNELDFSDSSHLLTSANIKSTWANADSLTYLYTMVDYGAFDLPYWQLTDLRLMVKLKDIMNRMFNKAGWKLTSAFLASDFISKLYVLSGSQRDISLDVTQAREFIAELTAAQSWVVSSGQQGVVFDNIIKADSVGNYAATGVYTFDVAFSGSFTAMVGIQYIDGVNSMAVMGFEVKIYRTRAGIKSEIGYVYKDIPTHYNSVTASPFYMTCETGELPHEVGDQITVEVNGAFYALSTDNLRQYDIVINSRFNNFISQKLVKGSLVDPAMFLPDCTQLEFFKAIRHKFNLVMWCDTATRTVILEPFDDFFLTAAVALDWSGYIDRSQDVVVQMPNVGSRALVMGYATDGDWHIAEFNKVKDLPFAAGRYEFEDTTSRDEDEMNCGLFAATYMGRCPRQWVHNINIPVIWSSEPDETTGIPERSIDHQPRLLYYNGLKHGTWPLEGVFLANQPEVVSYKSDVANDNSLMFGDETNSHGLIQKFYRRSLYQLEFGRVVTFKATLPEEVVMGFNPRVPVKIDEAYYLVNEISGYSSGRELVELSLVELRRHGKLTGKTITGNVVPPPVGKQKPPETGGTVYMIDDRFRPPQVFPVLYEDEEGNIREVKL